jgi:hypothetical protein
VCTNSEVNKVNCSSVDITSVSNNVLGEASEAMDSGVYLVHCVLCLTVSSVHLWCISWQCCIPCCFHNEVVTDCAGVVISWLLYCGGWSPMIRWGRQLKLHNFYVWVEFLQVVDRALVV